MADRIFTTEAVSSEFIHLNSCGRQSFFEKAASALRPNGRVDYHILYVTEGACFVRLGESVVEAREGSLILFLPSERQEYAYRKGIKTTVYYIHFSGTGCEELLSAFGKNERTVYPVGVDTGVIDLLEQMRTEYECSLAERNTVCAGHLLALLGLFSRMHASKKDEKEQTGTRKITEVCRYIETALGERITVASLAQMCYLSESRFSHLFKEVTKKSPTQYLIDVRIRKAKDLLRNSDLSVSHVGAMIGMDNPYYFSRTFRSRVGLSPIEYRKRSID